MSTDENPNLADTFAPPALYRNLAEKAVLEQRTGQVEITGSLHTPPPHEEVPGLVAEMCDHANANAIREPLETSAYLMWRVNWIHPFFKGNGRTSRAVSYLGLSVGLNMELPGRLTIPDQIVADCNPYYDALESVHASWREQRLDLSPLVLLLDTMLQRQLASSTPSA